MTYTLVTSFYDEPSICDEFDLLEDALFAWEDACWAYAHAPSDVCGDIRGLRLLDDKGHAIRKHGYN